MLRAITHYVAASSLSALLIAGCKSKPSPVNNSAEASPSSHLNALATAVTSAAAARRKSVAELQPPPLSPPDDAQDAGNGVKWQLLQAGDAPPPTDEDSIRAELSVWTGAGKLAYTSYATPGPVSFGVALAPRAIYEQLRRIGPGARARFWFSEAFIHSLGPSRLSFPDTALIIDYEPLSTRPLGPSTVTTEPPLPAAQAAAITTSTPFTAPDAAGPPPTALKAANGLRYVELRAGSGTAKPTPSNKLHLSLTLWPVTGLIVSEPKIKAQPSATTLSRAPAGLGQILQGMTEGATVRVWLPPTKANQVAPLEPNQEAVLDVTLEKIE